MGQGKQMKLEVNVGRRQPGEISGQPLIVASFCQLHPSLINGLLSQFPKKTKTALILLPGIATFVGSIAVRISVLISTQSHRNHTTTGIFKHIGQTYQQCFNGKGFISSSFLCKHKIVMYRHDIIF